MIRKSNPEEAQKMWDFFMEIWAERPHYSEVSGRKLSDTPGWCNFEHLLEKSKWENLKYEKDNIILVTCQEHHLKTNGYPLPRHKELIEQAKKKLLHGDKKR